MARNVRPSAYEEAKERQRNRAAMRHQVHAFAPAGSNPNACAVCGQSDGPPEHPDPTANSPMPSDKACVIEVNGKTLLTGALQVAGEDQVAGEFAHAYESAASANEHFLWLQGKFVEAERANANGAFWSTADLEFGQPSVKNGPLNWLHEPHRVVGTLVDSKLVGARLELAGGMPFPQRPHIAVAGVMWKHLYPRMAEQVEQASSSGDLALSMECTSDKVLCGSGEGRTGCGAVHPLRQIMLEPASVCDHLRQRTSKRVFQDPTFLGAALIVPPVKPAWREASATVLRAVAAEAERTWPQAEAAGYTQQRWVDMVTAAASL